ncbi:MAG: hypothetical protein ACI9DF_004142 [Verrucomicrobiales bacterium]|jgi:hypothetical protein
MNVVFDFEEFGSDLMINDAGDFVFVARLTDPAGEFNWRGIWLFSGGTVTELTRPGKPVGGAELSRLKRMKY